MVPILFEHTDTDYTTNGVGRLTDCVSCKVTEERNGIYEMVMEYPITGKLMGDILNMGTIVAIHDDNHDLQPFDIYSVSGPDDGIVTVYAHHVSYRLNHIILKGFRRSNSQDAFAAITEFSLNENPFTFSTDKDLDALFINKHPSSIREVLMGKEGSLLDVYGPGDYKFDRYSVSLLADRGRDTGVTVRFGKNMTGFTIDRDESEAYSAIAPYYYDPVSDFLIWPGRIILPSTPIYPIVPVAMDFYEDLSGLDTITDVDVAAAAKNFLDQNRPWLGVDHIKIDFTAMWQTPEYEQVSEIQRVGLCDTVSVYYTEMGVVSEKTRVEKVVYNVLTERFDEMELGTISKSYVAITDDAKNTNFDIPVASIVNEVIAALPVYSGDVSG